MLPCSAFPASRVTTCPRLDHVTWRELSWEDYDWCPVASKGRSPAGMSPCLSAPFTPFPSMILDGHCIREGAGKGWQRARENGELPWPAWPATLMPEAWTAMEAVI